MTRSRRGVTLLDISISTVLLSTFLIVSVRMLALIDRHERQADHRAAALITASNSMERAMKSPWSELTPERLAIIQLSPDEQFALGDARLKVSLVENPPELAPAERPVEARKITVEVSWPGRDGPAQSPLRLVAWRYHGAGSANP